MRLIAFSDVHLDAVTAGRPRKAEVVEFFGRARDYARANAVEGVLFLGDAHDPGSLLDPLYAAELIDGLFSFQLPVVAVAGNHDVVDSSELFDEEPITTLTPVRAARRFANDWQVDVADKPKLVVFGDTFVLCLPYVSKAHSARLQAWTDKAFADAELCKSRRLIVAGHLVVPGATIGSETVEMARGQDQLFPFERVELLQPALVFNGHYHARQVVAHGATKVVVPGSPLRFTFGEASEHHKGIVIVEA